MMKVIGRATISILFFSFLLNSCGGPRIKPGSFEDVKAPEWVIKGSGAFTKERGRAFYGVGSAGGIKNTFLLRATSDDRARNELAKIIEIYTASLLRDYQASTTAGDFSASTEEQHVELAIKTVVAQTLSGVEIIDHWEHPTKNELFSLARLDLEALKNNLENSKELNTMVRDFVRKNAENMHQSLIKEEERLGASKKDN